MQRPQLGRYAKRALITTGLGAALFLLPVSGTFSDDTMDRYARAMAAAQQESATVAGYRREVAATMADGSWTPAKLAQLYERVGEWSRRYGSGRYDVFGDDTTAVDFYGQNGMADASRKLWQSRVQIGAERAKGLDIDRYIADQLHCFMEETKLETGCHLPDEGRAIRDIRQAIRRGKYSDADVYGYLWHLEKWPRSARAKLPYHNPVPVNPELAAGIDGTLAGVQELLTDGTRYEALWEQHMQNRRAYVIFRYGMGTLLGVMGI
ncbi:MAG: hypothetical protein HYY37_00745 [Candidatus Aenigmarchaeota archaeon]|nr:hypothetical protein [Candidatus Aenigmarchaeota archaeon]